MGIGMGIGMSLHTHVLCSAWLPWSTVVVTSSASCVRFSIMNSKENLSAELQVKEIHMY